MPEGLSPIEASHELQRHASHASADSGHLSPWIPVTEAVLLSVVTILTAWASFSAAKWSTDSRVQIAHASTLRLQANRALSEAEETRNFDSSTFNTWFIAYTLGDPAKMELAERRFRPAFKVAFDAWQATDPEHNANAPPGPTFMPEYRQPLRTLAHRLDSTADEAFSEGQHSGGVADQYVRITVLLAAVLFLVGIGTTFKGRSVRFGMAGVGTVLLGVAVVLIAQQPWPR